MPGQHAILSCSGASIWLNCPPSARLQLNYKDTAGAAAEEGTLAHSLLEYMLTAWMQNGEVTLEQAQHLYSMSQDKFFNTEMVAYIEEARDYVIERFNTAKAQTEDAVLFLEQWYDLTHLIPEGGGTGDQTIIAEPMMEIVDLKYGKGVEVSAVDNPQMKLYALGALRKYGMIYDIEVVRMTIYQPRKDNISSYEMTVSDLLEWAENVVKPTAVTAFAGEGDFKAGKHCKFCKARGECRELKDYNMKALDDQFPYDPQILTKAEIAEVMKMSAEIKAWLTSVEELALTKALSGTEYPGFKIVTGRSNRKYADEEAAAAKLIAEGVNPELIYAPKKLVGITELSKKIGAKKFDAYLEGLIIKPEGAPTLVPAEDKRDAIGSPESLSKQFENFNTEE